MVLRPQYSHTIFSADVRSGGARARTARDRRATQVAPLSDLSVMSFSTFFAQNVKPRFDSIPDQLVVNISISMDQDIPE